MHSDHETELNSAAEGLLCVHVYDPDPNTEYFATVVKHFVTMTLRSTHFLLLPVVGATVGKGSA